MQVFLPAIFVKQFSGVLSVIYSHENTATTIELKNEENFYDFSIVAAVFYVFV